MTEREILIKCLTHVATDWFGEWPEDSWVSLGQYWEANVWLDGEKPAISVYPVWNGNVLAINDPIRVL